MAPGRCVARARNSLHRDDASVLCRPPLSFFFSFFFIAGRFEKVRFPRSRAATARRGATFARLPAENRWSPTKRKRAPGLAASGRLLTLRPVRFSWSLVFCAVALFTHSLTSHTQPPTRREGGMQPPLCSMWSALLLLCAAALAKVRPRSRQISESAHGILLSPPPRVAHCFEGDFSLPCDLTPTDPTESPRLFRLLSPPSHSFCPLL